MLKKKYLFIILLLLIPYITFADKVKTSKCVKLEKIDLDENDILDVKTQDKLFFNYYGKCIDSKIIKEILATISKYYINKGYITTKPYIKEQNIDDGQLDIFVLKGIIENIVEEKSGKSSKKIKTAFLLQKGKALNLRDLETSLEMINRVPSINAKFDIKPGSEQGNSIIEIIEKKSTPFHLQIGATDEGNIEDGDPYLTANASIDNPFKINDIFVFRLNGTKIQKEYQGNKAIELNYTFPLGSFLYEIVYFKYDYNSEIVGINDIYNTSGETRGGKFKINKIFFRNQTNKLKLTLGVEYKNTKNFFSNELIEVSSYKTTLAQVDLSHTHMRSWGQIISRYGFYAGTDWFGARDDSYFTNISSSNEAKLQFIKYTLDTNIYFFFKDNSYQLNSNIHAQYTNDFLYNNNKLSIGSYYTVRGYQNSLYGNRGIYTYNDFIKTFYPNFSGKFLQTISPSIGFDYGYIDCQEDNKNSCGDLSGATIALKTDAKFITIDLALSKSLIKVKEFKDDTLLRYNFLIKF